MNQLSKYRGCLLGLAAGDALGTTLEFMSPGTFEPITDIVGGGPFNLNSGEWTDDTSMALCLAESLIEKGFDPKDQLKRYLLWARDGHLSSNGKCFDIGNTVSCALDQFEKSGDPYSGSELPGTAGNGSLMRVAPVPLFYAKYPSLAIKRAGDSSRTTHGAQECIDACRYFAALIIGALRGESKEMLLKNHFEPNSASWESRPLTPTIAEIASGSFKRLNPPDIRGTGHVVKSLEAALWAFYHSEHFREGALLAVNLGDDADTTGAIYGQLAGAYYGEKGIPEEWSLRIAKRDLIISFAEQLFNLQRNQQSSRFVGKMSDLIILNPEN